MPKLDDETEFQDVSQIKFWDTNSKKTRRAVIGGYVIEIIERKSKKGIFATIVLESNYEFINVTIFPELFEEYGEFLRGSKKNILLVNGVIVWDKFRGEYILQANVNSLFTVLT
jgi:DNA polymerase III alpha subunit